MSTTLCMGCMNNKNGESTCPRCGYTDGTQNKSPALAVGSILDNRYLIGAVQKVTGEGITYIAMDETTGRRVTLREYLPVTICSRNKNSDSVVVRENCQHIFEDYLSDFLEISRAVSRLSDIQAIVPVLDIFEANKTAYAVYEYAGGRSFGELIERTQRLTWEEAKPLFIPLVSALNEAHAIGLVHFGINPDTVYITRDGNLVLTGFGIPDARIAETDLRPELCDGFSAPEQYSMNGKKGKATDVYSICALMLFALTGKCPPSAPSRAQNPRLNVSSALAETIPTHVLTAIAGGLQVRSEQRTPSMEVLRSELTGRAKPGAAANAAAAAGAAGAARTARNNYNDNAGPAQQRSSSFSEGLSNMAGKVSGFASNLVNQGRNQLQKAGSKKANNNQNSDEPWYRRLTQFQYGLLSACVSIIVLGLIALIVFLNVKPLLAPDDNKGPTVEYAGYASGTDLGLDPDTLYAVPDLRGMDWSEAINNPDLLMFQILQKDKQEYSDDYDVGQIINQSIPPKTEVPYGTPIAVTVSLGSKMCPIPNIIKMSVSEADLALEEAGLRLGKQTEQYHDSVPAGCIISISGAEIGSRLERGSAVNVVVSLGPEGVVPAQ